MQRYFLPENYEQQTTMTLTGENFHHMIHVMRMTVGKKVYLAFANEVAVTAQLTEIGEDDVSLTLLDVEQTAKELPIHVTIACGWPKGDKLEWIVQKATELGVHEIIGFAGQTSVVKWDAKKQAKKAQRLQKIAQEAAEQAHRQWCPPVTLATKTEAVVPEMARFDAVLVAYEESAKAGELQQLAQTFQALQAGQSLLIIFGPEGGLTPQEVAAFIEAGAQPCGLGPRILRTETAPLYALSAASYHFELQGPTTAV